MRPAFLTPPLERLAADGRFEPVTDVGATLRRPQVLLARELCSFELFRPGTAKGAQGLQAAQLYARANAPFYNPGFRLERTGADFGVWWWDRDRIDPWLAERFGNADVAMGPETLAQPPGAGWRIVRLAEGFELQCWEAGSLTATAWRREPPDAADWAAFARQVRDPEIAPPTTAPRPETLPIAEDADLGRSAAGELDARSLARLAAGAGAAMVAAASLFWLGQGLHLSQLSGQVEQRLAAEQRAAAVRPADDRAARTRIDAFRALAERPDGLAALADALSVLKAHGVKAKAFAIDGPVVSITVAYDALGHMDAITRDLEGGGAFSDVRPLPNSADKTIKIDMILKGAPAPGPLG